MQIPIPARTAALVLLVGAALLLGPGIARADDTDDKNDDRDHSTTTSSRMHVVVQGNDGTRTVKVLELKDGAWVAVEEAEQDAAGEAPRVRMRLGGGPGAVMLRRQGEESTPGDAAATPRNPMATVLRWLFESHGKKVDGKPFEAWFEADDVPLEGLRDALKADGWTANSLRDWMQSNLGGGPRLKDRYAEVPRTHTWFGSAPTPPHGQGHPMWGPQRGAMPWGHGMPHGYGVPHGYGMPYGYGMPRGHGGAYSGGPSMPHGYGPWMGWHPGSHPGGECPTCRSRRSHAGPWSHFFGRPRGHGRMQQGRGHGRMQQGRGQGRGRGAQAGPGTMPHGWTMLESDTLLLRRQGACEDCPKKDACKGKGCKGKGKGSCGGACGEGGKSRCEDCPNKGNCKGSCGGEGCKGRCEDCPNKGNCKGQCGKGQCGKDGLGEGACKGSCGKREAAAAK